MMRTVLKTLRTDSDTELPDPSVYRFQVALAIVFLVLIGLPLPLMLIRGLFGFPILHRNIGASEPPPPVIEAVPQTYLYARWKRKSRLLMAKAQDFQETFSKCFGGRDTMRKLQAALLVNVFHTSPAPLVLVGNDGWLIGTGEDSMDGFRGINPFSQSELAQFSRLLAAKQNALRSANIPYLLVVPPDKQIVYPEIVPSQYTRFGPGRLNQIATYLQTHPVVDFVDLTPPLVAAKSAGPLYWRYDTHWNYLGAFIGYHALAEHLKRRFPLLRPTERSEMRGSHIPRPIADLSLVIGLEIAPEDTIYLTRPDPDKTWPENAHFDYVPSHMHPGSQVISSCPTGEIARAVIFHDSFSEMMGPFLSRHFRHAVWVWGEFDPALVLREKPDIVIEERVERRLTQWIRP
jgi:hypothetical protein